MDLSGKDKRNEDHLNYQSSTMSPSWQFAATNLSDQSMALHPMNNFVPTCTGDVVGSSTCSSVSMVDSFCPNVWDNPNSQNLGLGDSNVHGGTSVGKGALASSRTGSGKALDLDWNIQNSIPKGGGFLPQPMSEFPADAAFIERAARFSCFTGGAFGDMVIPFSVSEPMNRGFKEGQSVQATAEVIVNDGLNLKPASGVQSPMNDSNANDIAKYVSLPVDRGATEGSPSEKQIRMVDSVRAAGEEKQEIGVSSNESYETEGSGSGGRGEPSTGQPSSTKGLRPTKRKRSGQDKEKGQMLKDNSETKQKTLQIPGSAGKVSKHSKDNSPSSDAPKEDYIHVRARRGQATNSHSLAERVRREKISERMKFLQDLVPGCSKVTGKAVMLDEIINYVQSLQRQVECLSMKLAAVNPRIDLNTEILQSRGGSSAFPFPQDVRMVHPSQALVQPQIPGMENPSDALRRTFSSHLMAINGGYRGPTAQMSNMWEDELNNVLQMNFGTNSSFNCQDSNAPQPPGHMKDEL